MTEAEQNEQDFFSNPITIGAMEQALEKLPEHCPLLYFGRQLALSETGSDSPHNVAKAVLQFAMRLQGVDKKCSIEMVQYSWEFLSLAQRKAFLDSLYVRARAEIGSNPQEGRVSRRKFLQTASIAAGFSAVSGATAVNTVKGYKEQVRAGEIGDAQARIKATGFSMINGYVSAISGMAAIAVAVSGASDLDKLEKMSKVEKENVERRLISNFIEAVVEANKAMEETQKNLAALPAPDRQTKSLHL